MREGRRAVWVSVCAVALVLWPVVRPDGRDSFPLSTYSMFSFRQERETELPTVVAVVDGEPTRLSPGLIAGTEEVIIAFHTVRRAIRNGAADDLCRDVAARVQATDVPATAIQVVTERHDAVAWFSGVKEPESVSVHAECPA